MGYSGGNHMTSRRLASLARAASIDDVRELARRRLPRVCDDFIAGGAEGEVTLGANRRAFDAIAFRPRYLVDVSDREQSTVVCGATVQSPVLLAPAGLARIVSRHAEVDAARAAESAQTVYCAGVGASTSLEEIARASAAPLWFQLYLWRDRELYEGLVARAKAAGYVGLIITIDVPVSSKRDRDWRNGFTLPLKLNMADRAEAARHVRWAWDYVTGPPITWANLADLGLGTKATVLGKLVNEQLANPRANWDDVRRLRDIWEGQLLVKGVLTAEDAELAVSCGADGVVVSNHGGRQLDHARATIEALPEIVAAVPERVDVILDSGVRRGSDVVKALALGARAVMIGRPYLWGLAAAGEAGVNHVLEILRTEIDLCLALVGRRTVSELDGSVLQQ
jgi:L-lactate dehydrogenase (cytochrome)